MAAAATPAPAAAAATATTATGEISVQIRVDFPLDRVPIITQVDAAQTLSGLLPSFAKLFKLESTLLARYIVRGVSTGYDVVDLDASNPNSTRPLKDLGLGNGTTILFGAPSDLKPLRKKGGKEKVVEAGVGSKEEKFAGLTTANIFAKMKACKVPRQRKIMAEFIEKFWRQLCKENRADILRLSPENFAEIIKSDKLGTKEIEIWTLALAWGKEEVKRRAATAAKLAAEGKGDAKEGKEGKGEGKGEAKEGALTEVQQLRLAMALVLPHVRIPNLTATEMATQVTPSRLLTPEQELAIYSHIASIEAKKRSGGAAAAVAAAKRAAESGVKVGGFSTVPRKSPFTLFTFDPERKGTAIQLSGGNRIMTSLPGHAAGTVLGQVAMSEGTHYWEVRVDRGRGGGHLYMGLANSSINLNGDLSNSNAFGWYFDGGSSVPGSIATAPTGTFRYAVGDVVGFLFNCEKRRFAMYVNQRYTGHVTVAPGTYWPAFGCYGQQDQLTMIEEPIMPADAETVFGI